MTTTAISGAGLAVALAAGLAGCSDDAPGPAFGAYGPLSGERFRN